MEKNYQHLTEQDRIFLRLMLERHYSKSKIADILGVHRSTIYREIKRNSVRLSQTTKKVYVNRFAHDKYLRRRKRPIKLASNAELKTYIEDKLLIGWSPGQIEGRLKRENNGACQISHETIYRYIYSDYGIRNKLYKKLRRKHFLRVKHHTCKPRFPKDLLINNRPKHIRERKEFGHWECHLMIFKRGIRGNLITLRERKTRFAIAIKNPNKTAKGTAINIISTINKIKQHVKTITFDQGSEFMQYQWIKDCLTADTYFCQPGSPYQKGNIENVNGSIRVELPRSYGIAKLHQKDIAAITNEINDRPLACLNYPTPAECFTEAIAAN